MTAGPPVGAEVEEEEEEEKTSFKPSIKLLECRDPGSPTPTDPSAGPRLAKSVMLKEEGVKNVLTEFQGGRRKSNVLN